MNILQAEHTTNEALQEHQGLEAELNRLAGLVISFQRELSQVRIGMQYTGERHALMRHMHAQLIHDRHNSFPDLWVGYII